MNSVTHQLTNLMDLPEWQALVQHQRAMAGVHLRDLFNQDGQRLDRLSIDVQAAGLLLDYSKNRVTAV